MRCAREELFLTDPARRTQGEYREIGGSANSTSRGAAVSALDVSVQAQILVLLQGGRRRSQASLAPLWERVGPIA
jgi:hypothetical protein